MTEIGYQFPADNSGQFEGFNDAGMTHFTGDRLQHLGREVPQNVLDARLGNGPARLHVKLRKISTAQIPDIDGLVGAYKSCLSYASETQNVKAAEFFQRALEMIASGSVYVLQIKDTGTTGLEGPCIPGKPYHNFMKAPGHTGKVGNASGSFGIGKYAPYVVSALRTVFVSTVSEDASGNAVHYVQGKSILMSHRDGEGQFRRGTGFWGVREGCGPADGNSGEVPDWLRMTGNPPSLGDRGTMISILGFEPEPHWAEMLAGNIGENFFAAISRGQMEAEIEGGPKLTKKTIAAVLENPDIVKAMEARPDSQKIRRVSGYLSAMSGSNGAKTITDQVPHLGTCKLHILVQDKLLRRTCVLRNGMLISENVQKLTLFNEFNDFAAVVECVSLEGNLLLRDMEPPTHDAFKWDNLTGARKDIGKAALAALADWVRKEIALLAKDESYDTSEIEELSAFFGDIEEEGEGHPMEIDPTGKLLVDAKPLKLPRNTSGTTVAVFGVTAVPLDPSDEDESDWTGGTDDLEGDDDEDFDETDMPGDDIPDTPPNDTDQTPPDIEVPKNHDTTTQVTAKGMPIGNVRAVVMDGATRRLFFTPSKSGNVVVELQSSGADKDVFLAIIASSKGQIKDGRIEGIVVEEGKRCLIEAELAHDFAGTLKVVVNEV